MRFLIGILTGGLLTLFIATAMDAPTHPILENTQTKLTELWDGLIDQTSDSLFEDVPVTGPMSAGSTDDPRERPEQTDRAAAGEKTSNESLSGAAAPASQAPVTQALPAESEASLDPAVALAAPEELAPSLAPTNTTARTGAAEMLAEAVLQTSAAEPTPLLASNDSPTAASWTLARETGTATAVWVPFHSQMSAEGFAARLGRELEHEFRVEKRGAGSYQVVFDAVDPIQQALLEARVREITGQ